METRHQFIVSSDRLKDAGIKPAVPGLKACADPEIFMRGGPTKMVIFGHRRGGGGGSNPQKIPKLPFFR